MDELLNLTGRDLLEHERVVAVATAMELTLVDINKHCLGHYELKPIQEVAFAMRDACVARGLALQWTDQLELQKPNHLATPEEWIWAAVLAWEEDNE